jgi:hypothetical protein
MKPYNRLANSTVHLSNTGVNYSLVKWCNTRRKYRWPKPEFLPARDVLHHGKLGLRLFAFQRY